MQKVYYKPGTGLVENTRLSETIPHFESQAAMYNAYPIQLRNRGRPRACY